MTAQIMPDVLKLVLLAVVVSAGIFDLRVRRIPNWVSVTGLVLGVAVNAFLVPHGFVLAFVGMLCALLVYLPLYVVRGMGAGDVKLMAAVGAIAGPENWFIIFLATALFAGSASLALVVVRRRLRETLRNVGTILNALLHRRMPTTLNAQLGIDNSRALRMPHGAFIASGAMLFLFLSGADRLSSW